MTHQVGYRNFPIMPDRSGNLPPEVAALGTPDHVFAPRKGGKLEPAVLLTVSGLVITGLMVLGIAVMMFVFLVKPFGANPPSAEVALGVGIACTMIGMVFLGGAVLFAGGFGTGGRRAYLFYRDALVELGTNQHRIISWKKLGPPRDRGSLHHSFPVEGESDLSFDYLTRDHAAIARMIAHKAAECRLVAAQGGAPALGQLSTGKPAKYFQANKVVYFTGAAFYRIYIVGKSVMFLKIADGLPGPPPAQHVGGLAGALANYGWAKRQHEFTERERRLERVDERSLIPLAAEFAGSFIAAPADILAMEIDPPSLWKQFLTGYWNKQEALLKVVLAKHGVMTLALMEMRDVGTAIEELPRIFGNAVKINVAWSNAAGHFTEKT